MNAYYKKKTKIFVWLAYGFMLIPLFFMNLEENAAELSNNDVNIGLIMLSVSIGCVLMMIGCSYWAVGKGYSKIRGIMIGFLLNFIAPIVMVLHSDNTVTKTAVKLDFADNFKNKSNIPDSQKDIVNKPVIKKSAPKATAAPKSRAGTSKVKSKVKYPVTCQKCKKTFDWNLGNPRGLNRMEMLLCSKHDLPFGLMKAVTCPHCGTVSLAQKPKAGPTAKPASDILKR